MSKKTNIIPEDNQDELENNSERTETVSNPSQKLWLSSQEDPPSSFDLQDISDIDSDNDILSDRVVEDRKCDINEEIALLRAKCGERFQNGNLATDVIDFQKLCIEAGATKLFDTIMETIRTGRQSDKRIELNEKRAMTIICTMMYGQSQQANWYQVALARTLKGLGVSTKGIETLHNIGVAAHPITVLNITKKISSTHSKC